MKEQSIYIFVFFHYFELYILSVMVHTFCICFKDPVIDDSVVILVSICYSKLHKLETFIENLPAETYEVCTNLVNEAEPTRRTILWLCDLLLENSSLSLVKISISC